MKIFFDHITGKLTNYDLIYSLPLAEFEDSEYDYAFENGWIPLSWYYTELKNLTWINARNTRLVLEKFNFNKKQKYILRNKYITVKVLDNFNYEVLSKIYKKYILTKKINIIEDKIYEKNSYHTFVIQTPDRDRLKMYLKKNGINTSIHYPIPIHLQPASKKLGYKKGDYPVTERQAKRILTLPINQFLKVKEIKFISNKINQFFDHE